jgi:predicted transcriptional regulator
MAFTLRLPLELDRLLTERARALKVSKQKLVEDCVNQMLYAHALNAALPRHAPRVAND